MKTVNNWNENLLNEYACLEVPDVLQWKKHFWSWILAKVALLFVISWTEVSDMPKSEIAIPL